MSCTMPHAGFYRRTADALLPDVSSWTPLMLHTFVGHFPTVRELLNQGASPSDIADGGFTALFVAMKNGCLAITKLLLRAVAHNRFQL